MSSSLKTPATSVGSSSSAKYVILHRRFVFLTAERRWGRNPNLSKWCHRAEWSAPYFNNYIGFFHLGPWKKYSFRCFNLMYESHFISWTSDINKKFSNQSKSAKAKWFVIYKFVPFIGTQGGMGDNHFPRWHLEMGLLMAVWYPGSQKTRMTVLCGKPRQGDGSQRKPPCSGTRGWEQLYSLPAEFTKRTKMRHMSMLFITLNMQSSCFSDSNRHIPQLQSIFITI